MSLVVGQPAAVNAIKPWIKQMRSSDVQDGILSEAHVEMPLENAPVRIHEFYIQFVWPTALKNELDRRLTCFLSQL